MIKYFYNLQNHEWQEADTEELAHTEAKAWCEEENATEYLITKGIHPINQLTPLSIQLAVGWFLDDLNDRIATEELAMDVTEENVNTLSELIKKFCSKSIKPVVLVPDLTNVTTYKYK